MNEEKLEGNVTPAAKEPDAAAPDAGPADQDEDIRLPSNRKRLFVWLLLALGAWAVVIGFGYLLINGLNRISKTDGDSPRAAVSAPAADNAARTVTVPAVRGVDATGCADGEIAVEGNRLVFRNGCAHPVFHGQ